MAYATRAEREAFLGKLGARPLFVCDFDGNVGRAYALAPGRTLRLDPGDDPAQRSIPSRMTASQIDDQLVPAGIVIPAIFAKKGMDVRLPQALVDILDRSIEQENPFSLTFQTARATTGMQEILRNSGVLRPDRVTLGGDSGAIQRLNGEKRVLYDPSPKERQFLRGVGATLPVLKEVVRDVLAREKFNTAACPDLHAEPKDIGINVHYRDVLTAYGQKENSPLDEAIGRALRNRMQERIDAAGPRGREGAPLIETLDGPATVEVKIAAVNKGMGLEALLQHVREAGAPVTAVVFCGDDVAKGPPGKARPGTDYFAMIRADELQERFGISVYNVHTHHPMGESLTGTIPEPSKSPANLAPQFPRPRIDLTVRTPEEMGDMIADVLGNRAVSSPRPARAPRL